MRALLLSLAFVVPVIFASPPAAAASCPFLTVGSGDAGSVTLYVFTDGTVWQESNDVASLQGFDYGGLLYAYPCYVGDPSIAGFDTYVY